VFHLLHNNIDFAKTQGNNKRKKWAFLSALKTRVSKAARKEVFS